MKRLTKYFVRGIFALLPAAITVVILISFFQWTEKVAIAVSEVIGADNYFPGLGLIVGLVFIFILGLMTTLPLATKILEWIEAPLKITPIVKSIYFAIKNLSDYFSPTSQKTEQHVVLVKYPGSEVEIVGLVTRTSLRDLPKEFSKDERVAVYLPLSYQVGGLTVFIPRTWVRAINMPVEAAMRSALTAWIQPKN